MTYLRESWGPDLDRRRTGGELPLLLVGWPWYQEVVGLSDEDKETESAKKHIKEKVEKSVKILRRRFLTMLKFQETLWVTNRKWNTTRKKWFRFVAKIKIFSQYYSATMASYHCCCYCCVFKVSCRLKSRILKKMYSSYLEGTLTFYNTLCPSIMYNRCRPWDMLYIVTEDQSISAEVASKNLLIQPRITLHWQENAIRCQVLRTKWSLKIPEKKQPRRILLSIWII